MSSPETIRSLPNVINEENSQERKAEIRILDLEASEKSVKFN